MASTAQATVPLVPSTDEDIFDSLLNLEDEFYSNGFSVGSAAGATSGRLEGRLFGLQKGFEKYLTLGLISGRTSVWSARNLHTSHPRMGKHVETLKMLVDGIPVRNEEEDVEEVEERIKRGKGQVRILVRSLRERGLDEGTGEEKEEGMGGMAGVARRVENELS